LHYENRKAVSSGANCIPVCDPIDPKVCGQAARACLMGKVHTVNNQVRVYMNMEDIMRRMKKSL